MREEPQMATFEDLSIDDSLDLLSRVQQYGTSNIALQRLVHVKMLTEAADSVPYDALHDRLLPLLRILATDNEWVVRQHLGEQLGGVARACVKPQGEGRLEEGPEGRGGQGPVGGEGGREGPGYRGVLELLLPLVHKLLNDNQEEVRLSTGVSLCEICALLKQEDRGKHALTLVLQLAHDDEQEELRMTAAKLLNDMVESLGPDLCHQFISPELVSLAEDPVFRVRKAAALSLHAACATAGEPDTTDRLLPAFIRLSKDDIYRVRKACAEALVDLSKAVSTDLRGGVLLEVFSRLSTDSSQFVRQAALQQLGPFLTTLPPEKVSAELLGLFTAMGLGEGEGGEGGVGGGGMLSGNEVRLWCAFSFPGVLWRVGWRRWREGGKEGGLRGAYGRLVRDGHWMVRKTLACSLHEMAKVMGGGGEEGGVPLVGKGKERKANAEAEGENEGGLVGGMVRVSIAGERGRVEGKEEEGAEEEEEEEVWQRLSGPARVAKELQFAFDFFLRDVEEVRMGVLNNMASFLSSLPASSRRVYLPLLCEIATRTAPSQWRPRETLAKQLPALLPLFPLSALHSVFLPLSFALLEDPVAVVRERVFLAFGPLYDAFAKEEEEEEEEEGGEGREALLRRLAGMANAETYVKRQLFVHVALALPSTSRTLPRDLFLRQVLPRLLLLARDRVSNVRISFARDVRLLPEWVFQAAEAAAAAGADTAASTGDGGGAATENDDVKEISGNDEREEDSSSPLSISSSSSPFPSSPLALTLLHLLNDDPHSDVRLYMGKCRKERADLAPLFNSRRAVPPSLPPPQTLPPSLISEGEGEGEEGSEEGQRSPHGGSMVELVAPLSPSHAVALPPSLPPSSLRPFEAGNSVFPSSSSSSSSCSHPLPPPLPRPLYPASSPPPPTTASSYLEDEITRLSPPPPSLTTTSSLVDMASLLLPPIATASSFFGKGEGLEEGGERIGEKSPRSHRSVLHPSSPLEEEIALLSSPAAAAAEAPPSPLSPGFRPFPPLTCFFSDDSSSLSDDPNAAVDPHHIHDILTHLTHDQNYCQSHTEHRKKD